ncbi:MAG: Gfo/Idh/MocA family oxidoreductase [Candidatus Firestonebacteria bacterium]
MADVKIGFIGTGGIANAHAGVLSQLPDVKIIACTDVDEKKGNEFASKYSAKFLKDYKALLDIKEIDAVYICTPPYLHKEQVIDTAKAKKHIFCEKPITLNLADADEIAKVIKSAGVKLMVGYILHFYPACKTLKDIFESGKLGSLLTCWSNRLGYFNTAKKWISDPSKSGGMTVEFFTHDLDWLKWVGGEVLSVYGKVWRVHPDTQTEDNIWTILTFKTGVGVGGASWASPLGNTTMGVIGTKGGAIMLDWTKIKVKENNGEEKIIEVEPTGVAMVNEDKHFIECIKSGKDPINNIVDAREVLRIALAVQQSSRENKVIQLGA